MKPVLLTVSKLTVILLTDRSFDNMGVTLIWHAQHAPLSMCPFGLLTDHGSNEAPINALGKLQAKFVQAFGR